ncbi:MAG: type III secretion system chaperone [Gammaproteobacteria bacterium]|nr:type III secretion system chaperone [Gammaproteobacteria bacterium]
MSNQRIGELLANLDLDLSGDDGFWRLVIDGRTVMIITDENADRMRIIVPVTAAEALSEDLLVRVMQANFDSALDARYAIAKDTLWSAYIHPLRSLDDKEFLLGLGQAVNLANTFGKDYSSGLLIFGGGDSRGIREKELLDELVEKGLAI